MPSRHHPLNTDAATFFATGTPLASQPPILKNAPVFEMSYSSCLKSNGLLKILDGLSSRLMCAITSTYLRCFMFFMRQLLRHLTPKSPAGPIFYWNSAKCFSYGDSVARLHMKK